MNNDWRMERPEDAIAAFELVKEGIRRHAVGHAEAVSMLALAGVRHLAGQRGQRLTLIGPSGVGKSTLLRGLADALDVPCWWIDCTQTSETNWEGQDLLDNLAELHRQYGDAAERAVIVMDEFDKIAAADFDRSSRGYRLGKQQAALPILGTGSEVLVHGWRCQPENLLIVLAGVFDGLPAGGEISPSDLIRLGFMPELVERMGHVIRLSPLNSADLITVMRAELAGIGATFRYFGLQLEIPFETLRYVASVVERVPMFGPRSAVGWIKAAADRLLIRHIEAGGGLNQVLRLLPDDIQIPRGSRRGELRRDSDDEGSSFSAPS